jgi:hypothetical protein
MKKIIIMLKKQWTLCVCVCVWGRARASGTASSFPILAS